MALDQKFFKKSTTAATGLADQEQGLAVHLDANDVDSYDGDGDIWYDINSHEVNVPLTDNDDNLEVHIDASNTNSYPGYGSTITDISTNGYSFSPHGNATFGADTKGYFTLDGSDDDLRSTDAITGFSGDLTFEWWFNASESNNFALLHANPLSNDTGINGIFIGNAGGGAGAIEIYRKTTGGTLHSGQTSSTGLSGMASDGWVHFVITITSANVCKFYKDGTYQGTLTLNGNGTNHDTYNFVSIGGYNSASYEFAGQMGCFRMYSEILTAAEIGQNFRAGNFLNYSSIIKSKHEATQGSLITVPATQGTLHTSNLQMNLLGSAYSSGATWTDSSGNGNNGAITGTPEYTDGDGDGDYLTFDGDPRLTVSSFSELQSATAFTIELWLRSSTATSDGMIWNVYDSSSSTRKFSLSWNNNNLRWVVYSASGGYGASQDLFSTNTFLTNTWYHVAATYNYNNEMKIYVDGVFEGAEADPSLGVNTTTTTQMRWGDRSDGYGVNTQIGQARFYNAALTAVQVRTNYNATKDLYQGATSLKLHLDANEYSGSGDWQDSANNNDGVINGATYTNDNNSDYFDFDGNDTITVAGSDLNPANTRAIELWFNADITSGATSRYMISNWSGSGNNYGYHIYIYNNTLRAFMLDQSQSAYFINFQSGGTVTVGKWHHAVLTIGPNASDNKLYLDGELKQTASSTSGTFPTTAAHNGIIIGAYGSSGYYDGKIAQVRAYKGTLTQAQINTNYNATKALYQNPTLEMNLDVSAYSGSGNLLDTAGSHDATITNATYDEELGNFFTFDGTGDYLTVAHDNKFNFDASCTFEMWIWRSANTNEQVLMHKGGPWNAYNGWFLNWTSSVGYYFYDYDTASLTKSGTTAAPLNQWHHFVLAYNSTTRKAKMYINGIEPVYNTNPTDGGNAAGATNTGTLEIGKAATSLGTGHPAWNGRIGDVKFYSGEMTQAQAAQNYLATKNNYPNGFNLNIYNGPVFSNANKEFSLNGSNQYFYNSGYPFDFGVNDYTVIIWFNSDTNNQNKALFSLYNTQGLMIDLRSDGTIRHYHDASGSSLQYYTSETVTIGTWYQLAVTLNRANNLASMFLSTKSTFDSTASTSSIGSTATRSGNGGTNIGRYNSGFYFDGKIANVRVYQKALSSSEIEAVWNTDKNNIP